MAKFGIYGADGTLKAIGAPTLTDSYMKPGVLDFREIASPEPINFQLGDFVGYEEGGNVVPVYPRTGLTYRLFSIPQAKRQARTRSYGAAILYQNVQFYDPSYYLTICPFRDLVLGDNRVHFSTQPAISVFDDVAGIAERLQACLDDMYPDQWYVEVATGTDYDTLMREEREFTVSGVSISGALDKIYEVWPEVGYIYSYKQVTIGGQSVWRNVVTIGGAGLNIADTYAYGKGNGLLAITKTPTNVDEYANRLYVYGSSRNMKPRWYNDQNIKDADSVDIQHLMLPVSAWGTTDVQGTPLPDPAKAFVQTNPAPTLVRPKTIYFDGTGDYKEIYPTIQEMTIKDVRNAMSSPYDKYYPSILIYADEDAPVDRVLSAQNTFDDGLAGVNGKDTAYTSDPYAVSASGSESVDPGNRHVTYTIFNQAITFTSAQAGRMNLDFSFAVEGSANCSRIEGGKIIAHLRKGTADIAVKEVSLEESATAGQYLIQPFVFSLQKQLISADTYNVVLELDINIDLLDTTTVSYSASGSMTLSLSKYREKTFKMSIRQIGFNIEEQAALGEGKTIAMRSGQCAGRTFRISSCTYDQTNDKWDLEVIRSNDDSLSQWFPNSQYPVRGASEQYEGDQFVILDIAMPDIYVTVAENRLLAAALDVLSDVSVQQWQYTPEIDAKFMAQTGRSIKAGDYLIISDDYITTEGTETPSYLRTDDSGNPYFLTSDEEKILLNSGGVAKRTLVDSVVINEGEAAIPTYKVTMRDKKKKSYSDTASVPGVSSTPVTTVKESSNEAQPIVSGGDSFFEEYQGSETFADNKKAIQLKEKYAGLIIPGWESVGGLNPGGGSGINPIPQMWQSLKTNSDTYQDEKVHSGHIPLDSATMERSGNTIALKSTLKTKIDNSIIGEADTGLTAPTKIRFVTSQPSPGSMAAGTLYLLVEQTNNNNS